MDNKAVDDAQLMRAGVCSRGMVAWCDGRAWFWPGGSALDLTPLPPKAAINQLGQIEKERAAEEGRPPKRLAIVNSGVAVEDLGVNLSRFLPAAHPVLFPTARGLMKDPSRRQQYGQLEWNKHVFGLHNRSWAQDFSFPFDLADAINRDTVVRKSRFIIGNRSSTTAPLDTENLESALNLLAKGWSTYQITQK